MVGALKNIWGTADRRGAATGFSLGGWRPQGVAMLARRVAGRPVRRDDAAKRTVAYKRRQCTAVAGRATQPGEGHAYY